MIYAVAHRESLALRQLRILPQALVYILDVDNGVVDKATYRYRYAAEAHGVDTVAHGIEQQY